MSNELSKIAPIGGIASVQIIRESDLFIFDRVNLVYASQPTATNVCIDLTERGTTGIFLADIPAQALSGAVGQHLTLLYFNQAAASYAYGDNANAQGGLLVDTSGAVVSLAQIGLIGTTQDGGGGGAPVRGRMDYVGFLDNRVLDVITGEEQLLTVILETDGAFPLPVTTITIDAVDFAGTVATVTNANIVRVVEDSQVYVMRFTLTTAQTATFVAGLLNLEVTLDNEKTQILGAIDMIASLN